LTLTSLLGGPGNAFLVWFTGKIPDTDWRGEAMLFEGVGVDYVVAAGGQLVSDRSVSVLLQLTALLGSPDDAKLVGFARKITNANRRGESFLMVRVRVDLCTFPRET
jgi:hypothetical protein